VLGRDPRGKGVHVSLRPAAKATGGKARGGKKAAAAAAAAVRPRQVADLVVARANTDSTPTAALALALALPLKVTDLVVGELVRGYVKAVSVRLI
jgi:hypothetical protein